MSVSTSATCEMLFVRHPDDGRRPVIDDPCGAEAIGTTEDGARVCEGCAEGMVGEGFRIDYDNVCRGCGNRIATDRTLCGAIECGGRELP